MSISECLFSMSPSPEEQHEKFSVELEEYRLEKAFERNIKIVNKLSTQNVRIERRTETKKHYRIWLPKGILLGADICLETESGTAVYKVLDMYDQVVFQTIDYFYEPGVSKQDRVPMKKIISSILQETPDSFYQKLHDKIYDPFYDIKNDERSFQYLAYSIFPEFLAELRKFR